MEYTPLLFQEVQPFAVYTHAHTQSDIMRRRGRGGGQIVVYRQGGMLCSFVGTPLRARIGAIADCGMCRYGRHLSRIVSGCVYMNGYTALRADSIVIGTPHNSVQMPNSRIQGDSGKTMPMIKIWFVGDQHKMYPTRLLSAMTIRSDPRKTTLHGDGVSSGFAGRSRSACTSSLRLKSLSPGYPGYVLDINAR